MEEGNFKTGSALVLAMGLLVALRLAGSVADSARESVIVQADSAASAVAAVQAVGGEVTHELGIIRAAAASLTTRQAAALLAREEVTHVYGNRTAVLAGGGNGGGGNGGGGNGGGGNGGGGGGNSQDTYYPTLIAADLLHQQGIDGSGVTIAVLDSGLWSESGVVNDPLGNDRLLARYDAIEGRVLRGNDSNNNNDDNGHGTHVTSVALRSAAFEGRYNGVAPAAELVSIKAFDANGEGTYADVIRGLDWLVAEKDRYGIRVVNLSFSGSVASHYWDDPLNQAVMAAWAAGIVVVSSAGNAGPEPMTIGVPANVPYVITVGAMTDSYTPGDGSDDRLASFSSAGPTAEGFVKPEVTAPGGHMLGVMQPSSTLAAQHPDHHDGDKLFTMSGTSQAAAVVTGAVALMLQHSPWMWPDLVKCRLMDSAKPALDEAGELAYSVFQQGSGLINAYEAVYSEASACANQGMSVHLDVLGVAHFGGRANRSEAGEYYIEELDGYLWGGSYAWGDGYIWGNGYIWGDGYIWGNGDLWGDGYIWGTSYPWWNETPEWTSDLVEPASVAVWVEQE